MKNLLFAILFCVSALANAQLYKLNQLDTIQIYTSLEAALQNQKMLSD